MTNALVASAVDPDVSAALQIYERIKPLKDALGVADLTDGELQVFAIVARHTGLDPFTRQIYAIKRAGKVTHQTGIDGYRSAAERTHQYAGSDEASFEECTCDAAPKPHPSVARVTVHRLLTGGTVVDQVGVARWHELKPPGGQDSMWLKMPFNQLAKCAEANGLRKAFPRVLGGVYIADELGGAPTIEGESRELPPAEPKPTAKDRIAARRAEREAAAQPPGEIEGDASWLGEGAEPAAATEAAPEPTTAPLDGPDLAVTIRAGATASALTGRATPEQRAQLAQVLADLGTPAILAGIGALWPDAIVDGKAQLTAAQADGLLLAASSLDRAALAAAWAEIVQEGAVA